MPPLRRRSPPLVLRSMTENGENCYPRLPFAPAGRRASSRWRDGLRRFAGRSVVASLDDRAIPRLRPPSRIDTAGAAQAAIDLGRVRRLECVGALTRLPVPEGPQIGRAHV